MAITDNRKTINTHISSCVFDTAAMDSSFAALPANTRANHFVLVNLSGQDAKLAVGGTGDEVTLATGNSITLYGNPALYSIKRSSGAGSLNVEMIIYV